MSSALEKGLSVISFLAHRPEGASVTEIAKELDLPPSGVHRLLKELEGLGYTRQFQDHGNYCLTLKLATAGLAFLNRTGIPDLSQPILDRLAQSTHELIRMALFDGDSLVWVGVSQGATTGLRYDPGSDHGLIAHLASSSCGQVWLADLSDDAAIAAVMKQGLEKPGGAGVSAPRTVAELMEILNTTRRQGYACNTNSFMLGMSAMAVLIRHPDTGQPIGTVSIAGPSARVTPDLQRDFLPELQRAAEELAEASLAGRSFTRWYDETLGRRQALK
ncbi:IclR family transcriptional regulator [Pseudooceanicola sp. CBS1P-1]|uniref:Helix-turn-helix domain-containing protein n=1 Tax=Pseudooceanicola albus TaxID=2692189 RepID=A0A6L7G505_9RHOB|nr:MULTISPECIES: IclR family transcriptional regulator [Pseudooceanicola]MBT9385662.1 IclR family transcriptional regulator [Pseudooceanicola endophyticus]MXN18929.1 helix-turn-helix domain-containing protein [Pseudooceanicola albus]